MIDQDVRAFLERMAAEEPVPFLEVEPLVRRAHRRAARTVVVGAIGVAVAVAVLFAGLAAIRTAPIPTDDPAEDLGIFVPVAGRIVYMNEGYDRGYDRGPWAVDPSASPDTIEGRRVAEDTLASLVRLGVEGIHPLDWSGDGTELLLLRTDDGAVPAQYLSILHADGTETQLNHEPMSFTGATIAPDGSRVVYATSTGLYVIDDEGGRAVRLYPTGDPSSPTFSPDGTQIAFLVYEDVVAENLDQEHVWVANADGTDAREILADEETVLVGPTGLEWSPTGDRLVIGLGLRGGRGRPAIYTFTPDGSDFTRVISGGIAPYWSPDGSRIAYTIPCDEEPARFCAERSNLRASWDPQPGDSPAGLAIADVDGSNVRAFGFAASGPWHPGAGGER